jgi:hypothetical protein
MTSRERKIIVALGFFGALCLSALNLLSGIDTYDAARKRLDDARRLLARTNPSLSEVQAMKDRLDVLKSAIDSEKAGRYPKGTVDLYSFGEEIRTSMKKTGLDIEGYRVVKSTGNEGLEFSIRGEMGLIFRFLESAKKRGKAWIIESCVLHFVGEPGNTMSMTLRMRYETE